MSGESDKAIGRLKQAAGDLTDNDDLKAEGEVDEATGNLKNKIDDIADAAQDKIDSFKDKLSDEA